MTDQAARLRELLATREYVYAPGVSTPIEAMLAERVGLPAVNVSGFLTNLCQYGYFDGLVGMAEMVDNAERIAGAVDIPVKADADTGYGGVHNVQRTVREYADAGVAAIHIEDQAWPKRCGHAAGKRVVPRADAEARIRAAVDARDELESDLVIIARTDAYGSANGDWEEHVERARLFWELGADLLLPEMPDNDFETAVRFADAIHETHPDAELYWNYSSNFQWTASDDPPTFADLAALGYRYISISGFGLHGMAHSLYDHFADLRDNEERAQWRMERVYDDAEWVERSSDLMFELADFAQYQATEERYLEDAADRYADSAGHRSDR